MMEVQKKTRADKQRSWFEDAIFYQIYPRSFNDTNGDGVGDLGGILEKVNYLKSLGITALWLSPFFPSPMEDFGYDVSGYCDVDPIFGTLEDFDRLIRTCHSSDIKMVIDFVPNHTSQHHPWFVESRKNKTNPYADWYIWADPKPDGSVPNNWTCVTTGSAWTYVKARHQYYLHSFLSAQPDLNWRNPEVREAIFKAMRFWFERGVDGLRVDMIDFLIKDEFLRDEPDPDYRFKTSVRHMNQPQMRDIVADMHALAREYGDRVIIGEINSELSVAQTVSYYGKPGNRQMDVPFNFVLMRQPLEAAAINATLREFEELLPDHAWPNHTWGNHDVPRVATRFGVEKARLAALILLTLRGTPFLYYGDELGMEDVKLTRDQIQDPWEFRQPGRGRDPNRTPLPWTAGARNAGFSSVDPWLPVGADNEARAVDTQLGNSASLHTFYRDLIALRQATPALLKGDQKLLEAPKDVVAYERNLEGERCIVIVNLGTTPISPGSLPFGIKGCMFSTAGPEPAKHVSRVLDAGHGGIFSA